MAKSVVGPWAEDKLDRLRKYLNAYTTIMKGQSSWCDGYHYIDAFAGPGEHQVRDENEGTWHDARQVLLDVANFGQDQEEQKQFLAGSPRVALDLTHPFTTYVFVERSPSRVAALEELRTEYGQSRRIVIRQRDCNQYLQEKLVNNPQLDWTRHTLGRRNCVTAPRRRITWQYVGGTDGVTTDYAAFEQVLEEAVERTQMRLLAYCLLPNHCIWCCGREAMRICPSTCVG
jgi:hypothetical protein